MPEPQACERCGYLLPMKMTGGTYADPTRHVEVGPCTHCTEPEPDAGP